MACNNFLLYECGFNALFDPLINSKVFKSLRCENFQQALVNKNIKNIPLLHIESDKIYHVLPSTGTHILNFVLPRQCSFQSLETKTFGVIFEALRA